MKPIYLLARSRKFLLLILDTVVSLSLYFVSQYAPGAAEDVKFLIGAIQPVFIALIGAIAYEDGQAKRASKG